MELIIGCGFGIAGGMFVRSYMNDDIKAWVPKGPEPAPAPVEYPPCVPTPLPRTYLASTLSQSSFAH